MDVGVAVSLILRWSSPCADKYIVQVSAMEGQFYRKNKTAKHPHTNMAKASLNMMVRTAAADYAKFNIYMNSVDTGWITGTGISCEVDYECGTRVV